MSSSQTRRFILVTRKTRLEELVDRYNTWPQAKFYLEHNQADVGDYLNEHDVYREQLVEAEAILRSLGPLQVLERSLLPNYQFNQRDIIVVVGQDGLVANTLKYLNGQPLIGVNPDRSRWNGTLLPFTIRDIPTVAKDAIGDAANCQEVVLAHASTNDGQQMLAVNDLFIGPRSHTSARYALHWNGESEAQSSSGIIVSTGLGSTGWFRSIVTGAMAISGASSHPMEDGFAWDKRELQFTVREPFPSQTSSTSLVFGRIKQNKPLIIDSHLGDGGIIFSDGIESDYLNFNAGTTVNIGIAERIGRLVI